MIRFPAIGSFPIEFTCLVGGLPPIGTLTGITSFVLGLYSCVSFIFEVDRNEIDELVGAHYWNRVLSVNIEGVLSLNIEFY